MKHIIIESRNTEFPNPILLKKGMVVELGDESKSENWKNWIWCITEDNKGWAPIQIIKRIDKSHGVVLEDYSALELNISKDDLFISDKEMNGWYFGYKINDPNIKGWVPKENVIVSVN